MKAVITGVSKVNSKNIEDVIYRLNLKFKQMRFVHDLEKLTIAGIGNLMDNAKIRFPVGNADISLYIGIDDDVIEDIRSEYFNSILEEGILGASPLLFPFTSPNALIAQASIAFDIRGESIVFPIADSYRNVIKYAVECINKRYTLTAIAGGIISENKKTDVTGPYYKVEFYFLEGIKSAMERGAKVFTGIYEGF